MTTSSRMKDTTDSTDTTAPRTITETLRNYYQLTKPGIIYGNCLTTAAGYLFASSIISSAGGLGLAASWWRMLATLGGTAMVIAAGCVLNNYLDRNIDKRMKRTQKRALVTGAIPVRNALWFAGILGILGITLLAAFTNIATVYIGLLGLYSYVIAYGAAKRRSHYGTLIGSIPGATPVVAGYTAVIGRFDLTAALLFLILAAWQLPHFYAIAIYRRKEYEAAEIPVISAVKGNTTTKRHMIAYIICFILACLALSLFGPAGISFAIATAILGIVWLWKGIQGQGQADSAQDDAWARGMFGYSLIVLVVLSGLLAANGLLP